MLALVLGCSEATSLREEPEPDQLDAGPLELVLEPSEKLAVLAGPLYTPAVGQEAIGFYGTDLGVSVQHHDSMRVLFGDTWAEPNGLLVGVEQDDSEGEISLRAPPEGFPDGDAVDAFIAAQTAQPWWSRAAPPLVFALKDGKVAPYALARGDDGGKALDMGLGRTVVTAFSNAADGLFAIFRRDQPLPCGGGAQPSCVEGFSCDEGLGRCAGAQGELAPPCLIGGDRCGEGIACEPVSGGGFCQDRTSSTYLAGDEDGRLESVVIRHEVATAEPARAASYRTRPWHTNKFTNPIAKTVADFDPARADPGDNDYRPADGSQPAREKVLLWGRPHTIGIGATGRDARLYFGYADMPERADDGVIVWEPQYLSGFDRGRPLFSPLQSDAIALDLSGEPSPEIERYDMVDKMAISYLAPLRRWVMLYGGDFPPPILNLFAGPNFELAVRDPRGAIHARFAIHPWGPWSAPVPALEAGAAEAAEPEPGSEYAPLGMLRHPGCNEPSCIPGEQAISHVLTPYGFLYAPNIFDPWTQARDHDRAVDMYWNVSTWNPYQVVLLKTRIRAQAAR